ncbi:MAG TPA: tetratricopeptide repeat protein [Terracidiphilus sp.]|jgi:tetratricopeptide (TPR) repeat protein
MAANRDPLAGKRLDSWKEIAAFFGRAERTVKRWETERGLPVHRVPGSGRGGVFAYSDELAHWLKGRSLELEADDTPSSESGGSDGVPATPTRAPAAKPGFSKARLAAWLAPLVLAGAVVLVFSIGSHGLHFKALANRHAPNAEAQELYLKGRYYWDRRTPDDLNKAVDYFTQAIVKDPADAEAYVGLADCYDLLREFGAMPPTEAYPRALAAAQRAVELDDTSAEAHNSLAFVTFWWSWQGTTAEREFKRALELNPDLVRAHHWYATYLLALGRHAEALDQIEQAQKLEPSSTAILADKGLLLWQAGRHKEGLALLKQLEASEPSLSSTHDYLARIFWEQQDYPSALKEARHLAELRHDAAGLAIADAREKGFAANGLPSLWEGDFQVRKDLFNVGQGSAYELAETCAALGKKKEGLYYLQIAFDRREANLITGGPALSTLQDEPAFQKITAQVKELLAQ